MRFESAVFAVLISAFALSTGGAAAEEAETRNVTTTWLPDPFANTPPLACDRNATAEVNIPTQTPSALLGMYDVENDPLSVSSFIQPAHGTVVLNPDSTFTYTPQPQYVGGDEFAFTVSDDRGGESTAKMHIRVVQPTGTWSTTSFVDLAEVSANDTAINHGRRTTVPRAVDWNGDNKVDLLVGANGNVWLYRNVGTATAPRFAAGVKVKAGGSDIQCGVGRVAIALADMNRDGKLDLIVIGENDRQPRWFRNDSAVGEPVFAAAEILKTTTGHDLVVEDIRADVADWNGDGLPDIITGSRSGSVKIAYNRGKPSSPAFAVPTTAIDADGRTVEGSYNLNVRIVDINQDGMPDFVDSYNWGTVNFRINTGSTVQSRLPARGSFSVSGPDNAKLNLHAVCDGPIVDFADFDGDGTIDLVMGGEVGGKVLLAFGQSGESYLDEIRRMIADHRQDLGPYLNDPAHASAKERMRTLQGALYGWLSWELTKQNFRDAGLWDGERADWDAAWKKYWTVPPGSGWQEFGFMRGNISWFYAAPQESLATQGNQYWNSTEGRIQVAIDRWNRGYKSNLTEVLFFMDIWSLGLNKIKFYENDNACHQVIFFAQLQRNQHGHIDRIDLHDCHYEFVVDEKGVVTEIVDTPEQAEKAR